MKIHLFAIIGLLSFFCSCTETSVDEQDKQPIEQPEDNNDEEDSKDEETGSKTYFTNPFINSDVPDICMIRVGEDFYMVSTTMYFMPGAPIMHSKDMVSWKIISYVIPSLDESEANNLEPNKDGVSDIYSQGQWAASLRYHEGWFYVMFITGFNGNLNHTYIYKTQDPAGEWQLAQTLPILHDSSLFFEDDGTPYIVTSAGEIIELNQDLTIKTRNYGSLGKSTEGAYATAEGCQFFKVNGKYYAFFMYRPDNRKVLCYKSDNLRGPYSQKVVLDDSGIAQGGLIDTPDGKWYGYFFQDIWPLGRCPFLTPCTWENDWPIMGDENGKVPSMMEVPVGNTKFPYSEVLVNDDFSSDKLGLTWQWNHNPDNTKWSLTERPGYMRLKTGRVMEDPTDIFHARNTLTQRVLNGTCSGRIAIDVSNMKNGDRAGLSAFNYYGGLIEVIKVNNSYKLSMATYNQKMINGEENNERVEMGEDISFSQDVVYLRTDLNYTSNKATFYYSLDGYTWNQLGGETTLIYTLKHFTGYRFAIFNYATKETGGYIDVDYFKYQFM